MPPGQVPEPRESGGFEQRDRLRAAHPALAMDDHRHGPVELAEAVGQLGQGDHGRAGDPADRDLLGIAHVENERPLAPVDEALSSSGVISSSGVGRRWRRRWARRRGRRRTPGNRSARVIVGFGPQIGHFGDSCGPSSRGTSCRGRRRATAGRSAASRTQDQLDRLGRLDHADQTRQDARARPPRRSWARGRAAAARDRGSDSTGPCGGKNTVAWPSNRKIEP